MTFFLINFSLAFCLIDFCIMKMWIIPHLVGDTFNMCANFVSSCF